MTGGMANDDPILSDLNPQQLEAVTAPDGPLLIVAGAGSGKTRVITRRIAHLVRTRGVRPHEIFAATFTNKAADEMKRRVAQMLGEYSPTQFPISTFHSLCARILRREHAAAGLPANFTICDERDQLSAVRHVMKRLDITDKSFKPGDAQDKINQCKIRMLGPEDMGLVASSQYEETYAAIFAEYQKYLGTCGAVDFEDLILRTVALFGRNPGVLARYHERYRHVMVDEYQDTNLVQFELVRLLAAGRNNIAVVGDEDQSIYSWRGANIQNLLQFEAHFPGAVVVRLERNYRSTANILKAAQTVIERNSERLGKNLFTDVGDGPPLHLLRGRDDRDESATVAAMVEELVRTSRYRWGDIAIFYRVGALSRSFEESLRSRNIPHRVVGGIRFYDRAEIKDMISYLQVVENPHNSLALLRIINTPRRGLGEKSIQAVVDHARREKISDYDAMCVAAERGIVPRAAAGRLEELVRLITGWRAFAKSHRPGEVLKLVLDETRYRESLGDPESIEVRSRLENLDELVNAIAQFETDHGAATLQDYLENVSLVSPTDDLADDESAVSLLTLHSAKGLEFRVVFMVGMEEQIFPSPRAVRESAGSSAIEEERRLFYVGITRAREALFLSYSRARMWYGEIIYPNASPFLNELPHEIVEAVRDPYDFDYIRLREMVQEPGPGGERLVVAPGRPPAGQAPAPAAPPPRPHGRYHLGMRVRHPMLGEGVIAGLSGKGANAKVLLQTDDGTMFNLLASHAKLEPIVE